MFASNAINALTRIYPSLALTQRPPGEAQLFARLEPGQRLRATVQTSLAHGEFMVALDMADGQALHMKLPPGVRSGDLLNLVFVSHQPRPTFALAANAPPTGVSSLLSETGRFIDNLLQRSTFPRSSATSSSATPFHFPLLATPPTDGAGLALSLASALGRSGLFYESHQAQWVMGTRSLAELLLEPQARLSALPLKLSDADAGSKVAAGAGAYTTNAAEVADPVNPAAMALVRQQLEVFETRQFAWQGVAWPGQSIAWEATEEASQKHEKPEGPNEQSSAAWKTCLRLTLPNLGQITANLRLDARGVEIRFAAVDPETAAVLRGGATPLASGLESAGIKLLGMGVDLDQEA